MFVVSIFVIRKDLKFQGGSFLFIFFYAKAIVNFLMEFSHIATIRENQVIQYLSHMNAYKDRIDNWYVFPLVLQITGKNCLC